VVAEVTNPLRTDHPVGPAVPYDGRNALDRMGGSMSERLQRIHALLRAGNVPCALGARPGLGPVLLAGTPDSDQWDVLISDTPRGLRVHDARGIHTIPTGSPDGVIADTVKLHVVSAWADRGDPEARAVIHHLMAPASARDGANSRAGRTQDGRTAPGRAQTDRAQPLAPTGTFDLFNPLHFNPLHFNPLQFNPLHFAGQMIDVAGRFGALFSPGRPTTLSYTFWSPWGSVQGRYTRR
jgi:hypothetical protein